MNQVIKTQTGGLILSEKRQAALATLDSDARKMMEAALSEPIKKANYSVTIESLIDLIIATSAKSGQSPKAEDALIYAQEVYSVVVDKFPTCTMAEIKIAFTNGVYDEYGQYYGLNPKSFIHFIRSYMTAEARLKARDELAAREKMLTIAAKPKHEYHYAEPEFWTEDLIASWKEVTDKFYGYYLEDNVLFHATPEACYWILQHSGAIKITDGYVRVLLKAAQERLRVETYQNKAKLPLEQIRKVIDAIDTANDEEINEQVRFIAKRIAVMNFFRKSKRKNIINLWEHSESVQSVHK